MWIDGKKVFFIYLNITHNCFDSHPSIRSSINDKNKAKLSFIFTNQRADIFVRLACRHNLYLGTWVKYDTSFLYFSCVSSIWGLSGKVKIGHCRHVPPVRNASRSRSRSAVERTLKEVSWSTWSKWKESHLLNNDGREFHHLGKSRTRTAHVVYRDSFE